MKRIVSRILLGMAALVGAMMVYLVATGLPPEIAGHTIKLKNLRKPFIFLLLLFAGGIALDTDARGGVARGKDAALRFISHPASVWLLAGVYGLLFLWQQLSEYFGVNINFIPFGFYDYMLYYLFQGKVNFTGLLHEYYHLNNILIFLAPLWQCFRSPLFLTVIYGFIASAAAIPLYGIARRRFSEAWIPFVVCLIYLNYRYLQNVLLMNFSVEIFYPLFVFLALYFAMRKWWWAYFLSVFLGLTVKEDSFLYFSALGVLVFFMKDRRQGIATVLGSLIYFFLLIRWFVPYTESTILQGDLRNFSDQGDSMAGIAKNIISNPSLVFFYLFGSWAKWRTLIKLASRLMFLPLCSPSVFLILVPLFPLFLQGGGATENFVDLRFHYAAAVIPFVFIAFVFGFSNFEKKLSPKWRRAVLLGVCFFLLLLNGGNYATKKVTKESLESIAWARSIPPDANLVTHGHLLPYIGYRKYNYYFAVPFEREDHPAHQPFSEADYYLIDLHVNLYPMDENYFREKIEVLGQDNRYELVRQEGERYLFRRKDIGNERKQ
ncbi:MAG TPA: DUF2079 domain-containing protein [Candidatus Omnitrophota bacterium]|nr:DUF2079 domain-containing protein [Candidatus Omnitrophota bacterium]